ncbi:MAG: cysteine--tRNA ligase [Bdellovibrio sp.]|nr:MAG: cysteine--tRNA ligase [Bdellovibrio sp.]
MKVYNTLTKKKEDFQPLKAGEVRMYVCGPTVYDYLHIGNYRGAIFYNMVRNWFEKKGFKVYYVYNFTDVDDKIINRARELGESPLQLAERFIQEFKKDYEVLKLKPHTQNPRVTEYIEDIIRFIKELEEKGLAYETSTGVYYDVTQFPEYGKLSHRELKDLESGHRIDVDEEKKHASDFALWKKAKEGEISWESPWGPGRPGWHIECSTMVRSVLGDSIDIHGGGMDLIFPHHENEIAQSEGCTGKRYVKYWMHNNMIEFNKTKMSKSLGNIRTGRSFLEEYHGEILKYMMLASHYRSPIDFADEQIHRSIASLAKFYSAMSWARKLIESSGELVPVPEDFQEAIKSADNKITHSYDEDFNTPEVFAQLFEVTRKFNQIARKPGSIKPHQKAVAEVYFHWMKKQGEVLSLFQEDPEAFLAFLDDLLLKKKGLQRSEIQQLVETRQKARSQKDFKTADEIRDKLKQLGIAVHDTLEGSFWEVEK